MKFLVIDPSPIYGRGISLILEHTFGPQTSVMEVGSRAEAARALQEHRDFEAVLFDIACYESSFWTELTLLVEAAQNVPVLIVTRHADPYSIHQALEAGVKGYISDTTSPEILRGVLEIVCAGGVFAPVTAMKNSHRGPGRHPESPCLPSGKHPAGLTDREAEILQALSTGASNKKLARALGVSEGTVKAHLKVVFRKLGVTNRTEAAIATRGLELQNTATKEGRARA